jgi:hypothetical protein
MLKIISDVFSQFASSFAGIHIALNKVRQRLSSWRWSMSATIDDDEMATETDGMALEVEAGPAEELALATKDADEHFPRERLPVRLPRSGALANPRFGPMVVINDGGYFVPLWTAGDLLRGCRYFWRACWD